MIVLDANILLELIEERAHFQAVTKFLANYADTKLAATTLSISHAFYMAESHHVAAAEVEQVVKRCTFLDVIAADAEWALKHYGGKDFEDALQVAATRRARATTFVTLDQPLAQKYPRFIPIELIG
jgi:predicted nucleic acid-binding protein